MDHNALPATPEDIYDMPETERRALHDAALAYAERGNVAGEYAVHEIPTETLQQYGLPYDRVQVVRVAARPAHGRMAPVEVNVVTTRTVAEMIDVHDGNGAKTGELHLFGTEEKMLSMVDEAHAMGVHAFEGIDPGVSVETSGWIKYDMEGEPSPDGTPTKRFATRTSPPITATEARQVMMALQELLMQDAGNGGNA